MCNKTENMSKKGIIQHNEGLTFIFAGKSYVTFLNTESGNRFTYKIEKSKSDDIYFASVLTNPGKYTFIGTFFTSKNLIHSPKSKINSSAQSVKVLDYVISQLKKEKLPPIIEIYHEGRCGKCGDRLTVPLSIERGYGPSCYKMINKSKI